MRVGDNYDHLFDGSESQYHRDGQVIEILKEIKSILSDDWNATPCELIDEASDLTQKALMLLGAE